jgi:hypothetical protein
MEPHEVIKAAVKALQFKGAFLGICSVGNKDEARDMIQRDIGIKREHWARGENKFQRLLELTREF